MGHGLPTNDVKESFFGGEGCGEQVLGGVGGSSFGQQNKGMVISCSGARVFFSSALGILTSQNHYVFWLDLADVFFNG